LSDCLRANQQHDCSPYPLAHRPGHSSVVEINLRRNIRNIGLSGRSRGPLEGLPKLIKEPGIQRIIDDQAAPNIVPPCTDCKIHVIYDMVRGAVLLNKVSRSSTQNYICLIRKEPNYLAGFYPRFVASHCNRSTQVERCYEARFIWSERRGNLASSGDCSVLLYQWAFRLHAVTVRPDTEACRRLMKWPNRFRNTGRCRYIRFRHNLYQHSADPSARSYQRQNG